MLKTDDYQYAYQQWEGFARPCRIRLYRAAMPLVVVVATAEPFTTWLVRLGPAIAREILTRHDLDPAAVLWISEVPSFDPADPDLDPAIAEVTSTTAGYYLQCFEWDHQFPGYLRNTVCEPVSHQWVEDAVLHCALDDGGVNPPVNWPGIKRIAEKIVHGQAGDFLRHVGILRVPRDIP